jgi:GntR family transcriptional regulator
VLAQGTIPGLGERTRINMISVVDQTSPVPVMVAQQSITVEPVPADLAVHIDKEPGEPVLRIDRLYFDARGRPIELGISWFHPDRYAYRLTLRRKAPPG